MEGGVTKKAVMILYTRQMKGHSTIWKIQISILLKFNDKYQIGKRTHIQLKSLIKQQHFHSVSILSEGRTGENKTTTKTVCKTIKL